MKIENKTNIQIINKLFINKYNYINIDINAYYIYVLNHSLQLSLQGYVNMYFFHLRIKIQKLMHKKKKKYSLKINLFFLIKKVEIVGNKEYIILHTKNYTLFQNS